MNLACGCGVLGCGVLGFGVVAVAGVGFAARRGWPVVAGHDVQLVVRHDLGSACCEVLECASYACHIRHGYHHIGHGYHQVGHGYHQVGHGVRYHHAGDDPGLYNELPGRLQPCSLKTVDVLYAP